MARSRKAETRLWVWSGSRVHSVLPLTNDVPLRRQRKTDHFVTIATMPPGVCDDDGPHGESFNFDKGAVVKHLTCDNPYLERFRISETRVVGEGRKKMPQLFEIDILVKKDRTQAWVIKP